MLTKIFAANYANYIKIESAAFCADFPNVDDNTKLQHLYPIQQKSGVYGSAFFMPVASTQQYHGTY